VIRTPPGDATARRLALLHAELSTVLAQERPDAVAVERVFFNSNVRTAMGVGQAAGVVLLCAEQAGLPIVEYTPTQVKSAITGSGSADKEQVGYMVAALLRLRQAPKPADAADALALALTHLQRARQPAAGGRG
jgi:crossover junction endodeoxyribonuclease RuvC